MAPIIISVEGNIGSGKSTFVEFLKQNMPNAIFLQEPVDEWNEVMDHENETILTKFYKNQSKYSFAFQMMAYISRLALLKKTIEGSSSDQVIITERCLNTDREVFAKMLYDTGMIEEIEYQIYLKWFYNFQRDYPIAKYLYLRTDPDVANYRVLTRNRVGENIDIGYLNKCHKYHEDWLNNVKISSNVITIDANESEDKMNEWLSVVQSIVNK
jgi:deoxyadenosine/deoxycytidine kinase